MLKYGYIKKYNDNSSTFPSIEINDDFKAVLKTDLETENVTYSQDPILKRT